MVFIDTDLWIILILTLPVPVLSKSKRRLTLRQDVEDWSIQPFAGPPGAIFISMIVASSATTLKYLSTDADNLQSRTINRWSDTMQN